MSFKSVTSKRRVHFEPFGRVMQRSLLAIFNVYKRISDDHWKCIRFNGLHCPVSSDSQQDPISGRTDFRIGLGPYYPTLYTLILGILGLLDGYKISIISAVGIGLFAINYLRNRKWRLSLANPFGNLAIRPSLLSLILGFLAIIQLMRIAVYFWYVPPYVWDTLLYHLVNVAEWVQKGTIFAVNTPVDRVYWPANFEVLESWFAVFLHNDLIIECPSIIYYAIAGASVYAIARTCRLNRVLSAAVVVFYLYTPSVAIQATACKNDIAIAALYLLSVAVLLDLLMNGYRREFPLDRRLLILGMMAGLGVGIKAYLVFLMPGLFLLGAVALWKTGKHAPLPAGIESPSRPWQRLKLWTMKRGLVHVWVMTLLVSSSLFLGGYWYVRNYVAFGNPFHPTSFRIGDYVITGEMQPEQFGPGQRGSPSLRGLLRNSYSIVTTRIFDPHPYSSHSHNTSGWGWFNFACGFSAFAYALLFIKRMRLMLVCFLVSFVGLLGMVTSDPWFMRFTLWFPCSLAVSFGVLVSKVNLGWIRNILLGLAIMCTSFNLVGVLNENEITAADFRKMAQLPANLRKTAELSRYYNKGYKQTQEIVPLGETIGFCFPNNGCGYPLYDNDFSRYLEYIAVDNIRFLDAMKAKKTRFLFVQRLSDNQKQIVQQAVDSGRLIRIRDYLYALK